MQRMMVALAVLAMIGLLLPLSGCGRATRSAVSVSGLPIQPEYATFVEVENFSGGVRVVVDEAREPGVWATVRRTGPEAPRRWRDRQELVDVQATNEIENGQRILRVVTVPSEAAQDVAVDVTVRIRRSAGTSVRNSAGSVELVRVAGPVHVENGIAGQRGGNVQIRTGAAMKGPVYVQASGGSILYQVGPGSTGRFDLKSERGPAEFVSRLGRVDNVTSSATWWRGVLNQGENEVVLRGERLVRVAVKENAGTSGPELWDGHIPERWVQRIQGK